MKPETANPKASDKTCAAPQPPCAGARNAGSANTVDSSILFTNGSEMTITHGAETYRLRLTRQNRLILTK